MTMENPALMITIAVTSLFAIGILSLVSLKGFNAWIGLKQAELQLMSGNAAPVPPSATSRIEVADLKERIRKLEAIAAGVDL
jgi:hypothetical protein